MTGYILRRLLQFIPVFLGTTFVVFFLAWGMPGDPLAGKCGDRECPDAFVAADKSTKNFWLFVVTVAMLVGFITVFSVLNLFGLLAVVGAAVYLADVKPALDRVMGRGHSPEGPHGRW